MRKEQTQRASTRIRKNIKRFSNGKSKVTEDRSQKEIDKVKRKRSLAKRSRRKNRGKK